MTRFCKFAGSLATLLLAAAVAAIPAGAATVSSDAVVITFDAGPGEANYVRILPFTGDGGEEYLEIREDSGAPLTIDPATLAADNCVYLSANSVVCDGQRTTINGADGNDLIYGGYKSDTINGGSGNDQLMGYGANDVIDGGSGDDALETKGISNSGIEQASAGADDLRGGDGNDLVSYYSVTSPLTLSVDDQANDAGSDNIHSDLEHVEGGSADDRITGNDGPNRLEGAGGTDIVSGGGGNDVVLGGQGIDQLMGDAGNDDVNGGSNGDIVDGGPGVDSLTGDTPCESAGCGGPDRIKARDGEGDSVVCRDDADTVEADGLDAVAGDCEMVERGSVPGVPDVPGGDTKAPGLAGSLVGRYKVGTALQRGITVGYSCDEACGVVGQVTVSGRDARGLKLAKTVVVAKGKSALAGPGKGKVKLRFTKKAKKKLRSRKKLKLKITLVAADSSGNASAVKRTVTLKR
jgi:Ca2+-binding RTX toxin-like protein